jgi:hypothetical protein
MCMCYTQCAVRLCLPARAARLCNLIHSFVLHTPPQRSPGSISSERDSPSQTSHFSLCTCGVHTTQMCIVTRSVQSDSASLQRQTLEPSFMRPLHTYSNHGSSYVSSPVRGGRKAAPSGRSGALQAILAIFAAEKTASAKTGLRSQRN